MTDRRREKSGVLTRASPRTIVAAALVVLALVFVFQNRQSARVHFLVVSVTSPMWVALLVAGGAGVLIGILAAGRGRRSS
ncbi:LapA family protein [Spirillospora sp. NPDC047279]|uniref:LapA family protein n=1 Tax=Spirillospora sp. NPDC047279 TaxID=3155478 RepID=UPI0033ED778C